MVLAVKPGTTAKVVSEANGDPAMAVQPVEPLALCSTAYPVSPVTSDQESAMAVDEPEAAVATKPPGAEGMTGAPIVADTVLQLTPSNEQPIVLEPAATPVKRPVDHTVALEVSEEVHVTDDVTSAGDPKL